MQTKSITVRLIQIYANNIVVTLKILKLLIIYIFMLFFHLYKIFFFTFSVFLYVVMYILNIARVIKNMSVNEIRDFIFINELDFPMKTVVIQ